MTEENQEREKWVVFQQDVLDVLRQYEGFFDYSERVGSLSNDSRPDFVSRITREDKKEIWVVDAKNKPEIDKKDKQRMEKYLKMLRSNPIDLGLEISELSGYTFRGIFVTSSKDIRLEEYEQVKFSALHQFLQKELIYTDTEKVVRDVAKMMERKQLNQSQARLLSRSIKPFKDARTRALSVLDSLETNYVDLTLEKAPFEEELPVEAVLTHESREKAFMIDIPYSKEALAEVSDKVEEVKKVIKDQEKEVYFAAVDIFGSEVESNHIHKLDEIENEIKEAAGILSPKEVAKFFDPKISTEIEWKNGYVEITDEEDLGFTARIATEDDINYQVIVEAPEKVLEAMKERSINSRKDFGKVQEGMFMIEFKVTEDLEIRHDGKTESIQGFKDTVKTVYQSSINPVLSKKVRTTI